MTKKKHKKKKAKKQTAEQPSQPKVTPYPAAGPKITEFEERLDAQLAGDATKPGRGRPRKDQEAEQIEAERLDAVVVANVVKMPFELWSINQNIKELALSDQEVKQIAGPVKQLLDYYLPQIPAIAYAWIALTVNGFWIMRTRLLLIAAIKESEKQASSSVKAAPAYTGPAPAYTGPAPAYTGPVPPVNSAGPIDNTQFPTEIKTKKV